MAKELTISLRIAEEMKRDLEEVAKIEDASVSYIIRKAIKEYVQKSRG